MAFCLVIDGKPIFYSSDVNRIMNYVEVLKTDKGSYKRQTRVDIISGYDAAHPKPIDSYPVAYRRCNRCLKLYTAPYYMDEKGKMGGCCLHCREKRKAQYRGTYAGYNPKYVNDYIGKKYGWEFVVKTNWNLVNEDARPIRDEYKPPEPIQRPEKAFYKTTGVKGKEKDEVVKEMVERPAPVAKPVEEKPTVKKAVPKITRWSYHFLYSTSKPVVKTMDWFYDYDDSVKDVHQGNRKWVDYSLVCYAKNREEADEKIRNFVLKHSKEMNSVKESKTDFGWE